MKRTPVVDMAYEIIDLYERVQTLEIENAELREYRTKYSQLLNESISHSGQMICTILDAALDPESRLNKMWALEA